MAARDIVVVLLLLCFTAIGSYLFGKHVADGETAARNLEDANRAAALVASANERVRQAEKAAQDLLEATAAAYENKLREKDNEVSKAVADLRAGRIRVRIPAASQVCDNAVPGAAPAPGFGDGGTAIELPVGFSEDLLRRFGKCDQVAEQLRAAQQVILDDRK